MIDNLFIKELFSRYFNLPNLFLVNRESIFDLLIFTSISVIFLYSLYHIIKLYLSRLQQKQPSIIFEVTPLKTTIQNPYTTQQLFKLINGLARQVSLIYRLFNITKAYSFEVVSTKNEGIRYLIRVTEDDADTLKKNLLSYLPGIKIKQVEDYIGRDSAESISSITEFKLSNHFAFPLNDQSKLEKHDPMAYTTGSMSRLNDNEIIAFQVIASPINKHKFREGKKISHLIYSNKDLLKSIKQSAALILPLKLIKSAFHLLIQVLLLPVGLIVFFTTEGREGPFLSLHLNLKKTKTNNPYQNELEKIIKQKIDQELFNCSIRVYISSTSKSKINKRRKGFISSLSSFNNLDYQSIKQIRHPKLKISQRLKKWLFTSRVINPFNKMVLSTTELSDIYHLPFTNTTKTEDIIKSYSKELPAPMSLKKAQNLDVVFANNHYGGKTTQIGLTKEERRRHMYIIGATGTGKSTLLLSMIKQDIENNKGLSIIDPHGDLIDNILPLIPESRLNDVVYFNPDDIGHPIGINLLELSKGLTPEQAIREKELIAESIISLFHKIYSDKYSGPRMEYILRNTIHTAFTVPDATLFTVYKLLINTPYRKSVTQHLDDENLIDFWKYEFNKAGDYQKVKMISPITNKIGRFLFSSTAKRILEQKKSTVDFDKIINQGKILLCNLSKGKIGEDNSEIFGVVIMTKIQLAALKRANLDLDKRKDFYLYVDEFQNFATPAFAQILSEARKYRLGAILAHQTTSQLEDKSLVNVTLANTGTIICFRTANPADERLILPQFQPNIDKGEIASLPSFNFYIKINAITPEEPFSGVTFPIDIEPDHQKTSRIIKHSQKNYTITYVEPPKIKPLKNKQKHQRKPFNTKKTKPSFLP